MIHKKRYQLKHNIIFKYNNNSKSIDNSTNFILLYQLKFPSELISGCEKVSFILYFIYYFDHDKL